VGLGVVVALADVRLEVGDDRATHRAGRGPTTAALAALERPLKGPVRALPAAPSGTPTPTAAAMTAAPAAPPSVGAAASSSAAPLRLTPPIIPFSPRHRSSLR
jgi:hypothetical protein